MLEEVTDFQFCTTIAGGASQDELDAAIAEVHAMYEGWCESDLDNDGITNLQEFLNGTPASGSIDIDGNARYDALTDGLLMLRHMFGLTDAALITGTVATDAQYKTAVEIQERISLLGDLADVDGYGEIDALTDGLIVLRYLFGLRGDSLVAGVVASNATRTSHEAIEAHLETLTPVL